MTQSNGTTSTTRKAQTRNQLDQLSVIQVADMVRKCWGTQSYQPGHTDATLAEEATRKLNRVVRENNVRAVRLALNLHEAQSRLKSAYLTQNALTRLETQLKDTGEVVLTLNHENVRVWSLTGFLKMQGMGKRLAALGKASRTAKAAKDAPSA